MENLYCAVGTCTGLEDKVAPSMGVEKGNREQVIYAVTTARQLVSHVLGQHCHPEENGSKL